MSHFRPPYDPNTFGTNVAPEAYDPTHGGVADGRDLSKVVDEDLSEDVPSRNDYQLHKGER